MTPATLLLIFWGLVFLSILVALVRRSYQDTPAGLYHVYFSAREAEKGFDEGEKIHRIGVVLAGFLHLLRAGFIAVFLFHRLSHGAWYSPGAWQKKVGEDYLIDLSIWQGLAVSIELLMISVIFLELVPQVFSSWRGKQIALKLLPFLSSLENLFSPLIGGRFAPS